MGTTKISCAVTCTLNFGEKFSAIRTLFWGLKFQEWPKSSYLAETTTATERLVTNSAITANLWNKE